MFAPLVKASHVAHRADAVAGAAAAAIHDAVTAPTRPVYLEISTDLLAAEVPRAREALPGEAIAAAAAAMATATSSPAAGAAEPGELAALGGNGGPRLGAPLPDHGLADAASRLEGAERPLIWAGSGARDAGAEIAALADKLAAPVLTTYGAAGLLAGHRCLVGLPPHVEPAGRLWDEADVVLAIGSDLDGVQTQNFAQPQPPALIAIALEPPVNYRVDRRADRRRRPGSRVSWRAHPASRRDPGGPDRRRARASVRRARRDRAALHGRDPLRGSRRTACWSSTCACPATGLPGSTRRPRRASCRCRSAGARSATRSRPRSAPRWRAPDRSSRSAATAASCTRAASSPRSRRSGSR
jgi:hypothetical protein